MCWVRILVAIALLPIPHMLLADLICAFYAIARAVLVLEKTDGWLLLVAIFFVIGRCCTRIAGG